MDYKKGHTDIVHKGWVGQMPSAIRPYLYLMRLDRPIGMWLLLLPAWWSILLSGGIAEWKTMSLFAIGAIIMRGAGCVVNDLWDRDLDGCVARTARRPIPNGDITPRQALLFLSLLLLLGFIILIQFNNLTIILGIISLLFVGVYPLMKRITWWPQAFLGLTFNFGALMGWSAVMGVLSWQAWAIYAAGFFWTLGYDTIYALQDRDDDALIGIKSSARWLTEKYKGTIERPLYLFYGIHFTLLWIGVFAGHWPILGGGLLISFLPFIHLKWQIQTLSINDPQNALRRFKSNRDYGLMVCAAILIFQYAF